MYIATRIVHFLSVFSSKFLSFMTIFHHLIVRMHNIPKTISIIGISRNQKKVGMTVVVNFFIRSVTRKIAKVA